MNKEGRIDSRKKSNSIVLMDFPDETRIKVEELADMFSEISGECIDFPKAVLICIDFVYMLKDEDDFGGKENGC